MTARQKKSPPDAGTSDGLIHNNRSCYENTVILSKISRLCKGVILMARENLRSARKQLSMTQQDVADALGISLVYYQKIEAGTRTGDFYIWDKLEDITGVHQRFLRSMEFSPVNNL